LEVGITRAYHIWQMNGSSNGKLIISCEFYSSHPNPKASIWLVAY